MRALAIMVVVSAAAFGGCVGGGASHKPSETTEPPGTITVTGVLRADRVAGAKDFQGMWLEAEGRADPWLISYRLDEALFRYVDRRVVARIVPYELDPQVQQVGADHARLVAIELVDGTTPDQRDAGLPPPPRVVTGSELRAHLGRWVAVRARLVGVPAKDQGWLPARLILADGEPLTVSVYEDVYEDVWRPLEGTDVTVVGRAGLDATPGVDGRLEAEGEAEALVLVGPTAICSGDRDSCEPTNAP